VQCNMYICLVSFEPGICNEMEKKTKQNKQKKQWNAIDGQIEEAAYNIFLYSSYKIVNFPLLSLSFTKFGLAKIKKKTKKKQVFERSLSCTKAAFIW